MASIEPQHNADGTITSYRVVWRDVGAGRTQSVPTLEQAQRWKAVLETAGHDTTPATEALLSRGAATPPPPSSGSASAWRPRTTASCSSSPPGVAGTRRSTGRGR